MKLLHLSKDLSVPADIATEAVALIGARGSGKTHAAGKLFEELYDAGVQTVWLDPVGVAYGLRLAKDGKSAGIPVPVFGGLHGDVPLEPAAGALISDLVVDKNISAVIDVSQFDTDADKARFVAGFSERLFQRKKREPSVIEMIIDEGQEFLPQNPQPGEQMMLHRLIRQIKIGRNFGMGVCIISPRPQEINKKALNGCQTVLAFRLTGAHERKAMKEWIAAHDLDQSVIEKLPSLETGNCHVWSPAFLKVNREIRILPKRTFDASATPKVGEHRAARSLAPIDLEQLRVDMKATIDKAKAEDPKELRRQIAELRKMVGQQPAVAFKEKVVEKRVEVPVLKGKDLGRAEALVAKLDGLMAKTIDVRDQVVVELRGIVATLGKALPPVAFIKTHELPAHLRHIELPRAHGRSAVLTAGRSIVETARSDEDTAKAQGPSHRRVVNTIAYLAQLGIDPATRAQVAVFACMTPGGGYYARILGELKTGGLVTFPSSGMLGLTAAGLEMADPGKALQTNADIHADVLGRLGPSHQRILRVLLEAFPNPATREYVAEKAEMDATGGYFARLVGELKTMGVITYPTKGMVRSADILFVHQHQEA